MQDFEKLGQFYLGRRYDLQANRDTDELLLCDSADLVTHALCLGMTGSGKTGLCLALIEEAAIDGVPALIVDPKGDLGNLLSASSLVRGRNRRVLPACGQASVEGSGTDVAQTGASIRRGDRSGDSELR